MRLPLTSEQDAWLKEHGYRDPRPRHSKVRPRSYNYAANGSIQERGHV